MCFWFDNFYGSWVVGEVSVEYGCGCEVVEEVVVINDSSKEV